MFYLSMFKFIPLNSTDFPPKSVQKCITCFKYFTSACSNSAHFPPKLVQEMREMFFNYFTLPCLNLLHKFPSKISAGIAKEVCRLESVYKIDVIMPFSVTPPCSFFFLINFLLFH